MFKNLFRGLCFFISMSFKIDYRYILYLFLYQIVVAVCAISLIVWPKFIIDELMGAMRLDRLIAYAAALVLIAQGGQVLKSHRDPFLPGPAAHRQRVHAGHARPDGRSGLRLHGEQGLS